MHHWLILHRKTPISCQYGQLDFRKAGVGLNEISISAFKTENTTIKTRAKTGGKFEIFSKKIGSTKKLIVAVRNAHDF